MKAGKQKTRKQKGGVLFASTQDIVTELVRFTEGTHHVLAEKEQAVIVELSTTPSKVLSDPCEISSVLLKIVAIDASATFNHFTIEETPLREFRSEVDNHIDIGQRSVPRFGCSIVPSILYADIYTQASLMQVFPKIGGLVTGTVGLIFMERIKHDPRYKSPTLYDYLTHHKMDHFLLKQKARRLFIMLAQLGFLHNDFHLNNIVVTKPLHGSNLAVLLIDFGRSTAIDPTEFNKLVEEYDRSKDEALKEQILTFLYRIEYKDPAGKRPDPDRYPNSFGWFKGDIADEVDITAPILLDETQKKNCVVFLKVPFEVRELLKQKGHLLKDFSQEERSNRILVGYAVSNFGEALEFTSDALRNDKEIVIKAVTNNSMALRFASPAMREDIDVLQIALGDLRKPHTLQFAIRPPKAFVRPHLIRDGLSLLYVPVRDKEMIMTAVRQNGMALHYVDKTVQDKDMVMAAVRQHGMALEYSAPPFHSDKEVVTAAVRQNGMALRYASPELRADEEVVFLAILQNGRAIDFTTLKRHPKLLLFASINGHQLTPEQLQLVMPYVDHYHPSHEEEKLIQSLMEPSERSFKRQKLSIKEKFNERYQNEIKKELDRLEKIPEFIRRSADNLTKCRDGDGSCSVSGGKNKKLLYGSRRKSRRTRTKSRHTRRFA